MVNDMKIIKVTEDCILFDNGFELTSYHEHDCCEEHYVDFTSINGQGWEDKEFPETLKGLVKLENIEYGKEAFHDYDGYSFCNIVDKKGNVYVLNIYNSNNGYYSNDVDLLMNGEKLRVQ